MSNKESDGGQGDFPLEATKLFKQVVSRLRDPAALCVIALYILAVPAGRVMDDYKLAFVAAFLFAIPIVALRAYKFYQEGSNAAVKLDTARRLEMKKLDHAHELKLLRLKARAAKSQSAGKNSLQDQTEDELPLLNAPAPAGRKKDG